MINCVQAQGHLPRGREVVSLRRRSFRLVNHCSVCSGPALLLHPSVTVTTSSETNSGHP